MVYIIIIMHYDNPSMLALIPPLVQGDFPLAKVKYYYVGPCSMVLSFTDERMKVIDHSAESRTGLTAIFHYGKYVHYGENGSEKKLVRAEDDDKIQGLMIDKLRRGHISRRDRKELAVRTSSSPVTIGSYRFRDRTLVTGLDSSTGIRARRGTRMQGVPC